MYLCLTQITALRSFIIEQLVVITKQRKKYHLVDSSRSKSNRLRDEITYLQEEFKTKNCILQTLLENQKVIQNTVNTGRFGKNTKIHTEPFFVSKTFALNIRAPLTNPISA